MLGKLLGLALVAYVIALIVTAPATLIDRVLQDQSGGRLRLVEAQGTAWSGSGQLEIRDAVGRSGVAIGIGWRVLPASLLRGHLVCEIDFARAAQPTVVTISPASIVFGSTDATVPAAALGLAVRDLVPLGLTGGLAVHTAGFSIGRGEMQGNVMLQWRSAGAALSPVSPLGDYELLIAGQGKVVRADLRTLSGPLQLDGLGTWDYGSRPAFLVSARIAPELQQKFAPFLRMIAVERSDGSYQLQVK